MCNNYKKIIIGWARKEKKDRCNKVKVRRELAKYSLE